MRLSLQYPRSFLSLLLSAFALVALPLLAGIAAMTYTLNRMAIEGRRSVGITAEVTAAAQRLAEDGIALQRAAGQYFVLEDPALKERLDLVHQRFSKSVTNLQGMPVGEEGQQRLAAVAEQEVELVTRLHAARSPRGEEFDAFKPAFDGLHDAVAAVADQAAGMVQQRAAAMSQAAARVERVMIGQALGVILLSLLLAALLARLVTRPVRQLAQAIRRLGEDDLATVTTVTGPRDMVYLGEQLDWLRRRLVELEEQKQRFLRHVSHELKTPLTALWEAVQLLADEVAGGLTGQQEEIVRIMGGSARELKRRIEDLLRYNEAVRQPESVTPMVVSLEPLVNEVAARFDLALRARDLQLVTATSEVRLWADRGRLDTALENLIANAIRFSPYGGVIDVAAETIDGQARITICDQGPGVSPEDRAYIFQPFYQGTNQPPGALHGSGLGLAIARTNIEAQGGELLLAPPEHGMGACFRVTLPCAQQDDTDAA
jgi:two-component system sensor histidine kinase GlrK